MVSRTKVMKQAFPCRIKEIDPNLRGPALSIEQAHAMRASAVLVRAKESELCAEHYSDERVTDEIEHDR